MPFTFSRATFPALFDATDLAVYDSSGTHLDPECSYEFQGYSHEEATKAENALDELTIDEMDIFCTGEHDDQQAIIGDDEGMQLASQIVSIAGGFAELANYNRKA